MVSNSPQRSVDGQQPLRKFIQLVNYPTLSDAKKHWAIGE
jgi:hypothetical protein